MERITHALEEHNGEVKLRVEAPAAAQLYAEAGRALGRVMGEAGGPLGAAQIVEVRSSDREALLIEWLNELIFRSERSGEIFTDIVVTDISDRPTECELRASIRGSDIRELRTQVKAATLHDLRIQSGPIGLTATIVLDV